MSTAITADEVNEPECSSQPYIQRDSHCDEHRHDQYARKHFDNPPVHSPSSVGEFYRVTMSYATGEVRSD
jgi:hypothetical protein